MDINQDPESDASFIEDISNYEGETQLAVIDTATGVIKYITTDLNVVLQDGESKVDVPLDLNLSSYLKIVDGKIYIATEQEIYDSGADPEVEAQKRYNKVKYLLDNVLNDDTVPQTIKDYLSYK